MTQDSHARLIHLLEQCEAMTRDFLVETAPMVAAYHAALVREGMTPERAITIALDAQRQLFGRFLDVEWGPPDAH